MAIAKFNDKIIVSACLAGINCTYSGGNNRDAYVARLVKGKRAISVCPEVLGGLPTPREMAEIRGGTGKDVLNKEARVFTSSGRDVTRYYIRGARKVLGVAKRYRIRYAILKPNSPACGFGHIYNGRFNGVLKKGSGVAAELLKQNGVRILNEKNSRRI